ncbi:hypothetical protein OF83DRAFT_1023996, partial [Amylostereum chailletii]
FLQNHPQRTTHTVKECSEVNAKVPTFVGGILPRADQGNYEDYCLTMLTLFKPWREGGDLKEMEQNWEQAFQMHTFSSRQKDIMKFMQIRYECNDTRDDFA